ncbi:TCP-1/cpn60 chaperonin family protein [Microlunatus parietis]|uniref:60 kDa chaperonin n=1 Tax=Microlunatus parietis TaxID=682979 RepID=A0A7Y9ID67_9ACTN|nr:TCP-1/cpn60 chaperonin family protein [Microlunatus parietis]NYE74527.1 chaperonin GroEL [Microlunatus parietis]
MSSITGADRMAPDAAPGVDAGFVLLGRTLAATLGPSLSSVLSAVGMSGELLTDSATIVRRITALDDRHHDTGAAIMRDLVTSVTQQYGDGGATAAVLAMAMLRRARRATAAGANPVLVRRGLARGAEEAGAAIVRQARPVCSGAELAALATANCGDEELGATVGELIDFVGQDGAVAVSEVSGAGVWHDYLDGSRWTARPANRGVIGLGQCELTLIDPVVAIINETLDEPRRLTRLLEVVQAIPGRPPLLLIAPEITEAVQTMLAVNDRSGALINVPVVLTSARVHLAEDLDDLALLTGASVLGDQLGRSLTRVRESDLGRGRRVVLRRGDLTLRGGYASAAGIDARAAALRAHAAGLGAHHAAHERVWLRQARLTGQVAELLVGAPSDAEREPRVRLGKRLVRLLATAQGQGCVPGGGVALRDSAPAVRESARDCDHPDVRAGMAAVVDALDASLRQLIRNSGRIDPSPILLELERAGPGHGFDATTGHCTRMVEAGIVDLAGVQVGAVRAAAATAGLMISAEVIPCRN